MLLYNARIVTPRAVVTGASRLEDGLIAEVSEGASRAVSGIDCEGDFLLPGLIDIHTDNLEHHFYPRPNVSWPSPLGAVIAHDWQMLSAGITTVFDALSLGDYDNAGARTALLRKAIDAVTAAKAKRLLRAEHFLHFRCELSDAALMDIVGDHLGHPEVRLFSIMDHTPGQRQWRDLAIYREYRRKKKAQVWSEPEFEAHIEERRLAQRTYVPEFLDRVAEVSRSRQLPLASHDDTSAADADEANMHGVTISEFPTTVEAARRARELGMSIVMGAPNVVLGGSHSGNVGASQLMELGYLDILASDYVPSSILAAVFMLADRGVGLSAATALATANPASALGLSDRGVIAPGYRADLIRVRVVENVPIIRSIWIGGQPIV